MIWAAAQKSAPDSITSDSSDPSASARRGSASVRCQQASTSVLARHPPGSYRRPTAIGVLAHPGETREESSCLQIPSKPQWGPHTEEMQKVSKERKIQGKLKNCLNSELYQETSAYGRSI